MLGGGEEVKGRGRWVWGYVGGPVAGGKEIEVEVGGGCGFPAAMGEQGLAGDALGVEVQGPYVAEAVPGNKGGRGVQVVDV